MRGYDTLINFDLSCRFTLRLPFFPLVLLKMRETEDAKERYRAIELVAVVGVKVDSNKSIEVAQSGGWVKCLTGG